MPVSGAHRSSRDCMVSGTSPPGPSPVPLTRGLGSNRYRRYAGPGGGWGMSAAVVVLDVAEVCGTHALFAVALADLVDPGVDVGRLGAQRTNRALLARTMREG